jgi:hypothetical protein
MQHHSLLELQDESKGENVEKIEAYFSFKKNSVATPAETTPLLWKTFHLLHSLPAVVTNFSIRNHFGTDQNRLSNHYNSI